MKQETETRYYKSQKYGWVEIKPDDRDWKFGISYDEWILELSRCKQRSYGLNA